MDQVRVETDGEQTAREILCADAVGLAASCTRNRKLGSPLGS